MRRTSATVSQRQRSRMVTLARYRRSHPVLAVRELSPLEQLMREVYIAPVLSPIPQRRRAFIEFADRVAADEYVFLASVPDDLMPPGAYERMTANRRRNPL